MRDKTIKSILKISSIFCFVVSAVLCISALTSGALGFLTAAIGIFTVSLPDRYNQKLKFLVVIDLILLLVFSGYSTYFILKNAQGWIDSDGDSSSIVLISLLVAALAISQLVSTIFVHKKISIEDHDSVPNSPMSENAA
eukprot:NODE_418_length_7796_cov_0.461868.p7 type:complete len:139 gc:universal NODE_418_length_7796_cov_0.461868:1872-1456(-)